jgi:hypothetical protein
VVSQRRRSRDVVLRAAESAVIEWLPRERSSSTCRRRRDNASSSPATRCSSGWDRLSRALGGERFRHGRCSSYIARDGAPSERARRVDVCGLTVGLNDATVWHVHCCRTNSTVARACAPTDGEGVTRLPGLLLAASRRIGQTARTSVGVCDRARGSQAVPAHMEYLTTIRR